MNTPKEAAAADRPEPGKVYRLTGDGTVPSISRGDAWAESEEPTTLPTSDGKPGAFAASRLDIGRQLAGGVRRLRAKLVIEAATHLAEVEDIHTKIAECDEMLETYNESVWMVNEPEA